MVNDKYILFPLMTLFLLVIIALVLGFSEINFGIFAGDIGLLVSAVVFAQEIRKLTNNSKKKGIIHLLRFESPLNWLKISTVTFVFSLISSLVYGLANPENLGVGSSQITWYLLVFSIAFFLFGLFYTCRIIWFIIDPFSTTNILVGKGIKTALSFGFRAVMLLFIGVIQFLTGTFLYQIINFVFVFHGSLSLIAKIYLPFAVLSFIAIIPVIHLVIFRLEKETRKRDDFAMICILLPWIILMGVTILGNFLK